MTEFIPVAIHTQKPWGERWLKQYICRKPVFACILGFTETALVPGISAAGVTEGDRLRTAIADAEVLTYGYAPFTPLPTLGAGISPAVLTYGILSYLNVPIWLFNAGLPQKPRVPVVDLGGESARCVSTGQALGGRVVRLLWQQGWRWGELLARCGDYLILSECVVGGTTTAQAVLTALGYGVDGMVSSSHRYGNAPQKNALVRWGLRDLRPGAFPWELVAAVGDPMQVVVAAMAIAASHHGGVLLAGGSQMVAVYALARAWVASEGWPWHPYQMAIATTPWVVQDPTAAVVALAQRCDTPPLLSSNYGFRGTANSFLADYAKGYVKEGVGLGAALVLAAGYAQWSEQQLLGILEASIHRHQHQMAQAGKP